MLSLSWFNVIFHQLKQAVNLRSYGIIQKTLARFFWNGPNLAKVLRCF